MQLGKDPGKEKIFLLVCSFKPRRIFNTPVGGHRLPRPDRADLASGIRTDRKYEIHFRGARPCELVPRLAAEGFGGQPRFSDLCEGKRIHLPPGMAAGAVSTKAVFADGIQDG